MGMAYASISNIRSSRQSDYSSRPFGLRVSKTAVGRSELYLGGPNPALYKAGSLRPLLRCPSPRVH